MSAPFRLAIIIIKLAPIRLAAIRLAPPRLALPAHAILAWLGGPAAWRCWRRCAGPRLSGVGPQTTFYPPSADLMMLPMSEPARSISWFLLCSEAACSVTSTSSVPRDFPRWDDVHYCERFVC
jgi:hypothetical protein